MSQRKLEIVKDFLGPYYKSNEEYLFWCPKCKHHKRKLSINFDKNVFKCWVCDYTGKDISRLVYSYGKSNNKYQWKEIAGSIDFSSLDVDKEKTIVKLPDDFITLTGKKIEPLSLEVRRYLKSRGLNRDDIVKWKIGYCPEGDYKERIIIPSFDNEGELSYFIARSYSGDSYKYKNPRASKDLVFNDLNIDWDDDIVIVEGAFDAIRHKNCIPILGSSLRENHKLFQKICRSKREVFLALDEDAKSKEFSIAKKFREYGVACKSIPVNPYPDLAEMPRDEFLTRKQNADFITDLDYLEYKLDF